MIKTWPHFDLHARLTGLPPFEELTAVDLGCGAYNSDVARQVIELPWKHLDVVDGFAPDLEEAKRKLLEQGKCSFSTTLDDVCSYAKGVKVPYDVVLSFDVLEHLTKEDGEAWLGQLERIAKRKIVLFLPIEPAGWHRIDPCMEANPLQEHLSHWQPHELAQRGYTVERITGIHTDILRNAEGEEHRETFDGMWAVRSLC